MNNIGKGGLADNVIKLGIALHHYIVLYIVIHLEDVNVSEPTYIVLLILTEQYAFNLLCYQ